MPNKNRLSTDSNSKRIVFIFLCLLIVAVLAISLTRLAIERIQSNVRAEYGASLNAVINTTEAALTFWSEQRKSELFRLSDNKVIQAVANQMNDIFDAQDLTGLETLRGSTQGYLKSLNALQQSADYHIISLEGIYLYSDKQNFNSQESPIKLHYPELFNDALSGQASFVPPMKIKITPNTYQAFAFFIAPIVFEEKIVGVIASSHNPEDEMSTIMSLGSMGESGKSYLVNEDGLLVSQSRFSSTLISLDKIGMDESEVLNVNIKTPSGKAENANQLALMADSVTHQEYAQNLSGYSDYRGVQVIGTWKWLPDLQLGMATEIDYAEANESFSEAKYTIIALVSVNVAIALSMAIILYVMSNKTNKQLRKAANKLEETVASRTQDLTNTTKQLISEKATIQNVLDNIPDPIFCKDDEGHYVRVNRRFAELSGYSECEIVGKSDFELFDRDEAEFFTKDDEKILLTGESHIVERSKTDALGTELLFETRKTLIHYNSQDKAGILGISRDITERRHFEEAMLNATRAAQDASTAKSEFLARMSHEIRTPMNGVLGMLDLLLDSTLNTDQTHKLKVAQNSASSLLTIINDILDFSRVEAGKMELESLDFNLAYQFESIAQTFAMQSHAKGVELIVDATEIEQNMVIGDPMRFRQVLSNLINNAIKFTEVGQIVVKISSQNKGEFTRVECSITDTGIGIPEGSMEHLFDSFSQVDSSTTRVYGGSGLGLAISKKLVDLMGGSIAATSVLNEGSTFTLNIDFKTSSLESKPLPISDINDWHVLVVDDNATNREILEAQLMSWGVRVTTAVDAANALQKLNEQQLQLDLIITDMNMPNKDGLSFVSDMKQLSFYKDVKILMLSSMSFEMSVDEFSSLGLDACLMKPVGASELFNTLSLLSRENSFVTENLLASYSHNQVLSDVEWPVYNKVLIVEDNPVNQLVAEGILNKFGLTYGAAVDGQIAIQTLLDSAEDQPYTLILMDCQMPVLDGYQTSEKIRLGDAGERYSHIPIIAMTANVMGGEQEKCFQHGMNGYVSKPIDNHMLQVALIEGFTLTPKHLTDVDKNLVSSKRPQATSDEIVIPGNLLTMDSTSLPTALLNQPNIYIKCLFFFKKQYKDLSFAYPNSQSEIAKLKDKLHTIKGSAGNIGLLKLYRLSASIENKMSDNKLLNSDLVQFSVVLSEAMQDIDSILEANEKPPELDINHRPAAELLKEIKPLVDRSELVPFELVDELSKIAKDNIEDPELYAIIAALEEFDYETSKKLIEGIL